VELLVVDPLIAAELRESERALDTIDDLLGTRVLM
jgi:hypothetical protein